MADWFEQPGLILFTENYDACARFYRDVLELAVLFDQGHLIAVQFGSGYLMVEQQGVAAAEGKTRQQNPIILRFNVRDIDATAAMLRGKGVAVEVSRHDWGIIGSFRDPDGNLCEIRNHRDGEFAARKPG